jgi:lipopolysaccharide export LptBFGC system permease protein LptF
MSYICSNSLDCPGIELCVDSVCKVDDTTEIVQYVVIGVLLLAFIALAWTYPLRNSNNQNMNWVSVMISILFFPAYIVMVSLQNPMVVSGQPNVAVTILVAIVFWPLVFFLIPKDGWVVPPGKVQPEGV